MLVTEWNTHAVVWRNKADLDTISMDDITTTSRCMTPENYNEAVNTAHGVSAASTQAIVANLINVDNLSDVMICAFFASQPIVLNFVHKGICNKYHSDDMRRDGFERWQNGHVDYGGLESKVECYNCHKRGHFARECRTPRNQDNKNKESSRRSVPVEISTSTALVSCDGLGGYDWSDQAEGKRTYIMTLMAFLFFDGPGIIGLKSVEEKLEVYKANESIYLQDIKGLKFEIHLGEIAIRELKKKLEIVQKEKDDIHT
ncbi:ribonuclease H-like domain-containing protein [Tanacetum coccineum]